MSSESIDNKLSRLEGSFPQLEKRFKDFWRYVNGRFDILERKIDINFRRNVGTTLTSFFALAGTMVTGFLTILSRLH